MGNDYDSLKRLCKFDQYSPKRMGQLKQIAEAVQCSTKKFQYLHNVRWLASKDGALSALGKDWKLVSASESVAVEGSAKNLLTKLTDFMFVYILHFLLD
jgi:hypothetical protein